MKQVARTSVSLVLAVMSLIVVSAGCTGAGAGNAGTLVPRATDRVPTGEPSPSEEPSASPDASAAPTIAPTASPSPGGETMLLKVYLLLDDRLVPVQREVPKSVATSRAAMGQLLSGPTEPEAAASLTTAIPADTLLLGLDLDDGVMTVDLSREFESGGGSNSMYGRLAQVVYTLTQFPTVDSVVLHLDGRPATVFSGEGVVLVGPSVREDYVAFLPWIFVDRPAWGATVVSPARISGMSNVFEATSRVAIRDATGRTLADELVTASIGSGSWGTFDVTVRYSVGSSQVGSVTVYNDSPDDGSAMNVRTYPIGLVP